MTNPYDRELSKLELQQIEKMMQSNPLLDFLYCETLIKMPKEDLEEIIKQSKEGTLPKDETANTDREYVLKTGSVS